MPPIKDDLGFDQMSFSRPNVVCASELMVSDAIHVPFQEFLFVLGLR